MNQKIIHFDFHCHTTKSDGKQDIYKMLKGAKNEGLDFLAVTDHNVGIDEIDFEKVYEKYGVRLIPGFELSLLRGHFLILGIDPKIIELKLKEWKIKAGTVRLIIRKKKMKNILMWAKENGALIIAAHPEIPAGKIFLSASGKMLANLYREGLIHGAEVHNNDLERRIKKRLYNLWHIRAVRLINKLEIPKYYQSDAHCVNRLGTHFNIIKTDSPENILEILKLGKIEIIHGKNK
jgi:histidinol phosphatase-like PHP family hydrolase